MEDNIIGAPLKDTLEEFKSYLENQVSYNKLLFTKRMSELSSYIMLMLVVLGLCGFVLFFLLFALANWFGELIGFGPQAGYLLVAGIYLLLTILVIAYREKLIFKPIRKFYGTIMFGDTAPNGDSEAFQSEEALNNDITKAQDDIAKQKELLSKKINDLSQALTITNIAQQAIGSAYNQIVTTSNIARYAFKIIQALKKFSRGSNAKKMNKKESKKIKNKKD